MTHPNDFEHAAQHAKARGAQEAFTRAGLTAHARRPAHRTWCAERVHDRVSQRLIEELKALSEAELTLYRPNSFNQWAERSIFAISVKAELPPGPHSLSKSKRFPRTFSEPRGWRALLARLRHRLLGEDRFVERELAAILAELARFEAKHCRAEGIAPAAGMQAMKERAELGRGAPKPRAPSAPRRGAL